MSQSAVEQYWTIVNRYRELLDGGEAGAIPPCPVDIPLQPPVSSLSGEQENSDATPASVNESVKGAGRQELLDRVVHGMEGCLFCSLSESRSVVLPGSGILDAPLFVVTDAPTHQDDSFGELLSGEAGDYLEKWLDSIGLNRRRDCYYSSIVKCMTPGGRQPLQDEFSNCIPYLEAQIALVEPKLILALGSFPFSILTGEPQSSFGETINRMIANPNEALPVYGGRPVLPIFHPDEVLKDNALRRPVWELLKRIKSSVASADGV